MAQGTAGFNILSNRISFADTASVDAFSRLRVANPTYLFDSQFTYDLQPLLFEQVTESNTSITHNTTDRCTTLAFDSPSANAEVYMQSYEWIRYQPGRGQLFLITFNMEGQANGVTKYAGIGDDSNGIRLEVSGTQVHAKIYSDTNLGDNSVEQLNWNIDRLDGTGPSGITVNWSTTHILVIDFQALYVGRVRLGLDIDGEIIVFHEFNHANIASYPYIQNASLPIRVGMRSTAPTTETMQFVCCSAISEGGDIAKSGFGFSQNFSVSAGSGTRTHALSVRPRTTFNSITNRALFIPAGFTLAVTGNSPVYWEVCLGQAITGTTTFTNVNTSYSTSEYNTAGTISGSPAVVLSSGYIPASNQSKGSIERNVSARYPITLDAAGAARLNGTLSLVLTGIGGASQTYGTAEWIEVR